MLSGFSSSSRQKKAQGSSRLEKTLPVTPSGGSSATKPNSELSRSAAAQPPSLRTTRKQLPAGSTVRVERERASASTNVPRTRSGSGSSSHLSRSSRRADETGADGRRDVPVHAPRDEREDELHRYMETIRLLQDDLRDATAKNQSMQQELLGLQEKQFRKMTDPRRAQQDDSITRHELSQVQQDITRIGKKYVPGLIEGLNSRKLQEVKELYAELQSIAVLQDVPLPEVLDEMKRVTPFGRVCFTGLLSWHIHHGVFTNPYFFMREATNGADWSLVLSEIDQLACGVDPEQASHWRTQTLQNFMPDATSTEQAMAVRERTDLFTHNASRVTARIFLKSPASMLLPGLTPEASQSLEQDVTAVFERAAKISMLLQSQGISLKVSTLTDLTPIKFRVDSPELQAHALHLLDDPADRRLDGQSVRVMVHPYVASLGTPNANEEEGQAKSRIFVKATVCVENTAENGRI